MAGLKINLLRIRGQKTIEALGGVQILSFRMDLSQINVPLEENLDQTASWGSGRESRDFRAGGARPLQQGWWREASLQRDGAG